MSRSIVSTTLAYTGGYIFLVLLAVCLATGAFSFFMLFSVLEVAQRECVFVSRREICVSILDLSFSVARLESFSFISISSVTADVFLSLWR
jgi:hypothetical protein